MRLHPHLNFDGRCAEAFKFYEQCLDGKISFSMTYGESPAVGQVPADWGKKIIHATLSVGDDEFSGADAPPNYYQKAQGFHVALDVKDAGEAERIFKSLAENATVEMPLQETFWATRFGMLVDRFGIPWLVNCSKPM